MSYDVRLESDALAQGQFEVTEIRAREALSRPYEWDVEIAGGVGQLLDEEALLDAAVRVAFYSGGELVRAVHGVVRRIESDLHAESGHLTWVVRVVPRLADLAVTSTTEIALEMGIGDIVEDRLQRIGLASGDDYQLKLGGSYAAREFVVQFKESHLDFVGRLTEHDGIAYHFEQADDRELVVFTDDNSGFPAAQLHVPFRPRGERLDVFELRRVTMAVSQKVRVRDYNYRTPGVDLTAHAESKGRGGERYEYGAHVKTAAEAAQLARVRAEELEWQRKVYEGRSTRAELSAGMRFTLEGHPAGDRELLVVEVEHDLRQPAFLNQGERREVTYENRFRAIEASVPFRPLRRTPKPFVPGVLTGIVEAAQQGDYAEIDGDGRYHVRFLFDTGSAPRGKASRPIRMMQPHAGPGYGFHFPLRDGVEVVLSCVEGDPDRPIIAGAVPNPTTPSTVTSKNAPRNVIRTGGGTEINIDDTGKGERMKISVPFANTVLQLGAPNAPVEGVYLGTDKNIYVTSNEGMNFEDDTQITANAPSTWVHGTSTATLEGDSDAYVKSGSHVTISAPTISSSAGAVHEIAAPVITASADGAWSVASGAVALLHGGASVGITSPTITVEGASVLVDGGVVTIQASGLVKIVGGGSVDIDGPTVNIHGGSVDVKGGPIKLNA